jgi:hypothetical protein
LYGDFLTGSKTTFQLVINSKYSFSSAYEINFKNNQTKSFFDALNKLKDGSD